MSNTAKLKKKAAELEQKKQFDRALQIYIQLLEEAGRDLDDADVPLYNRVGDLLMRQGNSSDALAYYEKAVDVYAERGFLNNAIALCNKVLRQSPARTSVYYKLGKISAAKGFKSDAKKNFLEYADRMQKAGQLNEAFRALKEFADLCPDQEDVRLMLAELLSKENRKSEALEQLHVLHEKLEHEGRGAEARATIDRMKAIDPEVVPRASGTQRVQRGGDLVFLDLNDEPAETESASGARETFTTPESAVPPLDGLSLTFLPEDLDDPAGASAPDAIDGLELASQATEEDIDALLAPLPGIERSGQFEAIPDNERDAALEDLQLVDLEIDATNGKALEADEDIDELEGLEGNQVNGAEIHGKSGEPAHLQERPLSGSEFAAIALQESSVPRTTSAHDLVLPSGLPMLGVSATTGAEDRVPEMQPAEASVSQFSGSAEGLLLDDADFGAALEPTGVDADGTGALDSESPIEPGDTGDVPAVAADAAEPQTLDLPPMEAVQPPALGVETAPAETASAPNKSPRGRAPRAARLSDEIELRYIHSGPLTLPDAPSDATPAGSAEPASPDVTEQAAAMSQTRDEDEAGREDPTPRDSVGAFPTPDRVDLEGLELTDVHADGAPDFGMPSESSSSDILSSTPGFGVPKEVEADLVAHSDDTTDSIRPDHWLGNLAPDSPTAGESSSDDVANDRAGLADPSVAGPVLRPVFDDLSAAMLWTGANGRDQSTENGADDGEAAHRAQETPRGRIVFGGVHDQLRSRLELDPTNWPLRRQLAEALLDIGDRESGMEELDAAMSGFEIAGDLIRAQEVADLIIRVIPTSVRHHQKRVEYAVRASDRVRLVDAYLELGDALFRTGDPDKASVVYLRVLELSPGNERAKFALATVVALPPEIAAPADTDVRPDEPDSALDFADVVVRAAERELVRTTPQAQEASEATLDAYDGSVSADALLESGVAPDGAAVHPLEDGVGKASAAEAPDANLAASSQRDVEPVDSASDVVSAGDVEAPASDVSSADLTPRAAKDRSGAIPVTPPAAEIVAAADAPSVAPVEAHEMSASESDAKEDSQGDAAMPVLESSALDTTFLRAQTAPRAADDDARTHRKARARTPIGVRDDEFVDLGEWLRMTEPQKSTRMVVDETAPSGDEKADFEEMLRHFKRGIAENVDEEDYTSHYDLGVAYKEMGLTDEAIAEFQKSLRGDSHRVRSYEALGQCFVEKGQFQVAGTLLQRAIETATAGDHELVGVLYLMGYASESLGRRAEALRYYQRVFSVDIEFRDVAQRVAAMEHSTT